MKKLALIVVLAFRVESAPCRVVDRDRILGADLAGEIQAFSHLDPKLSVTPAPAPGTHRTFSARELALIATTNGIAVDRDVPSICFERAVAPLTADRIRSALRSTLGDEGIRIELIDYTRQPMPSGELLFPRDGLTIPNNSFETPALWRGSLTYAAQHSLAVWATVRLHQRSQAIVAARRIPSGTLISADDLKVNDLEFWPFTPHIESLPEALGRTARKTIPSGTLISNQLIEAPLEVSSGDTVIVVVTAGQARITLDAIARSRGRKGDRILLLNPESHRTFRAVLDGKGQAHIGGGA